MGIKFNQEMVRKELEVDSAKLIISKDGKCKVSFYVGGAYFEITATIEEVKCPLIYRNPFDPEGEINYSSVVSFLEDMEGEDE